ncbi:hypothetical protein [Pandoraea soli]
MIKIVGYGNANESTDNLVVVTANNNKIQISYNAKTIEIDPSIVTTKPDFTAVYEGVEQTMVLGWDSERFNTRDMASSIADRKGIADIVDYVCLIGFDVNVTYVVLRKPVTPADSRHLGTGKRPCHFPPTGLDGPTIRDIGRLCHPKQSQAHDAGPHQHV